MLSGRDEFWRDVGGQRGTLQLWQNKTTLDCDYVDHRLCVYMDTNIRNKWLIRIKMHHVNKLCVRGGASRKSRPQNRLPGTSRLLLFHWAKHHVKVIHDKAVSRYSLLAALRVKERKCGSSITTPTHKVLVVSTDQNKGAAQWRPGDIYVVKETLQLLH